MFEFGNRTNKKSPSSDTESDDDFNVSDNRANFERTRCGDIDEIHGLIEEILTQNNFRDSVSLYGFGYNHPEPFISDDFTSNLPDKLGLFQFGESRDEEKIKDTYFSSVLGPTYKEVVFMNNMDYSKLWRATKNRDLRILRAKYLNPRDYQHVDYDFYALSTGHIIVISEGARYLLPPSARRIFVDSGAYLYGFTDSFSDSDKLVQINTELKQNILGLFQNMPSIFEENRFEVRYF